jgi:hypothetical protein
VVDATDKVRLLLVACVELLEDEQHQVLEHAHNLMVVLLELHLQIETSELGQVTGCVGVLGTEDGANLHDLLEARCNQHLLVELRRLGEVRRAVEVLELEDVGTALRRGTNDLGRVDKGEALLGEELLEESADTTLDNEDGLVDLGSEVNGPVVQPGVEADKRALGTLLLLLLGSSVGGQRPLGILDLQRQGHLSLDLDEQLLDVDLKVLDGGTLDGLLDALDKTGDQDGALGADVAAELDHLLAQLVAGRNDGLDGVEVLAQVQESQLGRLNASVLDPAAECNLLVLVVGSIGDARASSSGRLEALGSAEGKLAVGTGRDVDAIGLLLLGAISQLTGFGGGLLLSLRGISAQPRSIGVCSSLPSPSPSGPSSGHSWRAPRAAVRRRQGRRVVVRRSWCRG